MYFTNSSDPKRSDEALVMRGDVKRLIFKATHPGQVFRARDLAQRLGLTSIQVGAACRELKDKAFEIARPRTNHEQQHHLWRRIELTDNRLRYLRA